MTYAVDESQRKAARLAGFVYLFAMATAVGSEAFARGPLIVANNAAETARNILAHERLFRLSIASYLLFLASNAVLVVALYSVLERVDRNTALFASFMRLVQIAVGVAVTGTSFDVLHFLGSVGYLQAFNADQLHALARTPLAVYHDKMAVSLVFLGVGSAVFGRLWYRSGYIPKVLAALGIVGGVLLAVSALTFIVFPNLLPIFAPAYFAPHFLFEVTMGFLLLFKPLPIGRPRAP